MSEHSQQFGMVLQNRDNELFESLLRRVAHISRPDDPDGAEEVRGGVGRVIDTLANGLASGDDEPIITFASGLGEARARERLSFRNMLLVFAEIRRYVWDMLEAYTAQHGAFENADLKIVEDVLHIYVRAYFGAFRDFYGEMQSELLAQREELEHQRALVRELGTPIVPLYESVLLVPLVGTLDTMRANMLMEGVLEEIAARQAETVLVDITGVPLVDTDVANNLMMLTRAAKLLGAEIIMAGISADIAQTLVQLGIGMHGMATHANLQSALVYALGKHGLAIRAT